MFEFDVLVILRNARRSCFGDWLQHRKIGGFPQITKIVDAFWFDGDNCLFFGFRSVVFVVDFVFLGALFFDKHTGIKV